MPGYHFSTRRQRLSATFRMSHYDRFRCMSTLYSRSNPAGQALTP